MRICRRSRLILEMLSLIKVKNVDIFLFCSQSSLRSLASKVMRVSMSLDFGSVRFFAFCIDLTVCFPCFCFGSAVSFEISGIEVLAFIIDLTICLTRI